MKAFFFLKKKKRTSLRSFNLKVQIFRIFFFKKKKKKLVKYFYFIHSCYEFWLDWVWIRLLGKLKDNLICHRQEDWSSSSCSSVGVNLFWANVGFLHPQVDNVSPVASSLHDSPQSTTTEKEVKCQHNLPYQDAVPPRRCCGWSTAGEWMNEWECCDHEQPISSRLSPPPPLRRHPPANDCFCFYFIF